MPYAKKKKRHTVLWIVLIALTLCAITAEGLFVWHVYQEDQATRARLIEEATPRIVVPTGYFSPEKPVEKAESPKNIAAVRVTPGLDFYADPEADEAAVSAELDGLLAKLADMGMNAILLDTRWNTRNAEGQIITDGKVVWPSAALSSMPVDVLRLLGEKASGMGLRIYAAFHVTDIAAADGAVFRDHLSKGIRFQLGDAAAELAGYPVAAVQLEGYYPRRDGGSFRQFVVSEEKDSLDSSGYYERWLQTGAERTIEWVREAVRLAKPELPVGIGASAVWANKASNESGSDTKAAFQILSDGHTDAKALVEGGSVDFVNVSVPTSRKDADIPFETAVAWWNGVCQTGGVPLYITAAGEYACTEKAGWNGMDELSRLAIIAQEAESNGGVMFTGLSRLEENPNGSTQYLTQYLEGKVDKNDVETDLTISVPNKYSTITYEEKQQFRMKFDPNQKVYLNGEELIPTERGGVSVWLDLDVGPNTFTITHKGQTLTYKVERQVIIFDSVSPTQTMKVAGSSTLEFSVKAYKGSKITATIAGQTIQLKEVGSGDDELDSNYVTYIGSWTVPKATAKEQPLGSIVFKGSYQMYSDQKQGSSITIDKLPDEVDPDAMTGQVYQHAVVTDDYAFVYPYKTAPEYPEGILYQLPKGTQDVVVSRNGDYLNLRSGKTVKITTGTNNSQREISLQDIAFPGNNHVSAMQLGVEGNKTVIRMTMDWKAPFSVNLSPYPNSTGTTKRSDYTFVGNTVTLLLDYTTVIKPEVVSGSLDGSPIFSGVPTMERVRNDAYGIYQYKLTLPLNQQSRYYGVHAEWEGNDLVLRFNHPPTSTGSLSGATIMVDPGHGGKDVGTMAGSDVVEKEVNLLQAQKVASALQSLGANVILLRDSDQSIDVYDRTRIAHQYGVDMYLSIHHNSAGWNSGPNGIEVYYNTPFSQPLGYYVHRQVTQYMNDRGFWTKNFLVAREVMFPSLLIECGYLSNPGDEALAQNESHQWDLANAIAQGVLNYYNAYN